jgi:hypothetical protein
VKLKETNDELNDAKGTTWERALRTKVRQEEKRADTSVEHMYAAQRRWERKIQEAKEENEELRRALEGQQRVNEQLRRNNEALIRAGRIRHGLYGSTRERPKTVG